MIGSSNTALDGDPESRAERAMLFQVPSAQRHQRLNPGKPNQND